MTCVPVGLPVWGSTERTKIVGRWVRMSWLDLSPSRIPRRPSSSPAQPDHQEPAITIRRPTWVTTKPVCRFVQGNRIRAAQRMFAARKARRRANPFDW